MREDRMGEVCPACGVPSKNFEPFKDNRSEKRRFLMELDLHPIAVHFPQAYTIIIFPLILAGAFLDLPFGAELLATARVLTFVLPLTLAASIFAGIIDGKLRFKRLTTPSLQIKIMAGGAFMLFSVLMLVIVILYGFTSPGIYYLLLLNLACIACQTVLGQVGKTLMKAHMPG
jgi:hypothetical protein